MVVGVQRSTLFNQLPEILCLCHPMRSGIVRGVFLISSFSSGPACQGSGKWLHSVLVAS